LSLKSWNGMVTMETQIQELSPSKTRRKSSYGTSKRSILKKSFSQEQVTFTAPLSDDPLVALIGKGRNARGC